MLCDLNRSITVGFLTSLVILAISYFIIPNIKTLDTTKLMFLFVVFFVIATSMDYFNYCKTKCADVKSSITYGVFTVAIVYAFYGLFVRDLKLNNTLVVSMGGNVILLTILHYLLCDIRQIPK
jgi:hypothetical protein